MLAWRTSCSEAREVEAIGIVSGETSRILGFLIALRAISAQARFAMQA